MLRKRSLEKRCPSGGGPRVRIHFPPAESQQTDNACPSLPHGSASSLIRRLSIDCVTLLVRAATGGQPIGMAKGTTAGRRDRSTRSGALLRELYEGGSRRSAWFRYGLLLFDAATLIFLVVTSFVDSSPVLEFVDAAIGIVILADFVARLLLSQHRFHDLVHPLGLADVAVIISFLAPVTGHELGFLRALRALRH
jgi:hypothetical protein